MPADLMAALLARFERGAETEDERQTIARALRAAADGRPIAEIVAANARDRRDDALRAMLAAHFAEKAPSRAAKDMAQRLARYAASAWPIDCRAKEPPRSGTLARACFDVMSAADDAPAWRTIFTALQRTPRAVAKPSGRQASMEATKC